MIIYEKHIMFNIALVADPQITRDNFFYSYLINIYIYIFIIIIIIIIVLLLSM